MVIVERLIQQVKPGGWTDLEALDAKFNAVEQRLGFPAKRRLRYYFGGHDTNTLVIERQWENLAQMEAAYERAFADPDWQALSAGTTAMISGDQHELLAELP
jgi:hypothetical protein